MSHRRMIVASSVVVLALSAVGAAALSRLPAGAQLATHWSLNGRPDRMDDAVVALFMPPVLAGLLSLVLAAVPRMEPLQDRLDQSAGLLRTAWAGLLGMMTVVELFIAAPAFGWTLPDTLPLGAAGVLLVLIGNALPKSRPGFFVGIRTPWTIIDPENWIATHRLGARTTVLAGVAIIAAAVLPLSADARTGVMIVAIGLTLVPVAYSWWFWQSRRTA